MYRISKYHIGQQDAENLMKTVSLQRKGLMLVTLTNFENTSAPEIARGSLCDVANTLYESAGESILGTAVEGMNYIKLIPTSDDNIGAYYSQTAPVWNAELGGWYGVGDSINHRYVAGFTLDSNGNYKDKYYLSDQDSYGTGLLYQPKSVKYEDIHAVNLSFDKIDNTLLNANKSVAVGGTLVVKKPCRIILPKVNIVYEGYEYDGEFWVKGERTVTYTYLLSSAPLWGFLYLPKSYVFSLPSIPSTYVTSDFKDSTRITPIPTSGVLQIIDAVGEALTLEDVVTVI